MEKSIEMLVLVIAMIIVLRIMAAVNAVVYFYYENSEGKKKLALSCIIIFLGILGAVVLFGTLYKLFVFLF